MEYAESGPHGSVPGGCFSGRRRNVLELKRDHRRLPREFGDRVQIVVGGRNLHVGHVPRGGVLIRREHVNAITHPPRRQGEHPAELAAAEYAQRRAGKDGRSAGGVSGHDWGTRNGGRRAFLRGKHPSLANRDALLHAAPTSSDIQASAVGIGRQPRQRGRSAWPQPPA
jgi:hypothetical protein